MGTIKYLLTAAHCLMIINGCTMIMGPNHTLSVTKSDCYYVDSCQSMFHEISKGSLIISGTACRLTGRPEISVELL